MAKRVALGSHDFGSGDFVHIPLSARSCHVWTVMHDLRTSLWQCWHCCCQLYDDMSCTDQHLLSALCMTLLWFTNDCHQACVFSIVACNSAFCCGLEWLLTRGDLTAFQGPISQGNSISAVKHWQCISGYPGSKGSFCPCLRQPRHDISWCSQAVPGQSCRLYYL